ncbi:MAG: GatB/YqeY domain-containing protein, partial [Dehalococcoidia bacterium]
RYMPEQLTGDEIRAIAQQTADEVQAKGPQDKGKLMGKLMPKVKGKADGSVVNQVVTEVLEARASA